MAETVNATDHRTLPSALRTVIERVLLSYTNFLRNATGTTHKYRHYAGEFLAEDNLNQLKAEISQFPHIFYDFELIDEVDSNSDETIPTDRIDLILFCCVANYFEQDQQWYGSYDLAWDVRRAFQGLEFESTAGIHSNAICEGGSIERELHIPGLSVHTLRLSFEITHDSQGVFVTEGYGYNFELTKNSHYIPLA